MTNRVRCNRIPTVSHLVGLSLPVGRSPECNLQNYQKRSVTWRGGSLSFYQTRAEPPDQPGSPLNQSLSALLSRTILFAISKLPTKTDSPTQTRLERKKMAVNPPQLVGKQYVGFSLPIGLTLATFSLLSLVFTICCTFYSLKEAFDENFPLIVLPSIPL